MSQLRRSSSSSSSRSDTIWNKYESIKAYCNNDKLMSTSVKTGHRRKVLCLEWNVNGKYLASGSADSTTFVYKLDSDRSLSPQITLDGGQKSSISAMSWNPKIPSVLCTASEDQHVYLWNIDKFDGSNSNNISSSSDNAKSSNSSSSRSSSIKSCKPYHIIKTGNALNGISWSNDGTKICISDRESTITLVDGHKYTELKKYKASSGKIHSFVWSNDDKYILVTTKDGYVQIFDSASLSKVHEFRVHSGSCFCIDLCRNNKYIATGGADSMVTIICQNNLIQKYGLTPFETSINCVSFNFNSKLIASSSDDHVINVSYIGSNKVRDICQIKTRSSVSTLRWHPTRHLLAFAGHLYVSKDSSKNGSSANINIWGAHSKKY